MPELKIERDHPAAAGHFPGNPIIPGAWLLAAVAREIALAAQWDPGMANIKSAKFFLPVRPGDCVNIEYEIPAAGEARFQCAVAGAKVLTGVMHATGA